MGSSKSEDGRFYFGLLTSYFMLTLTKSFYLRNKKVISYLSSLELTYLQWSLFFLCGILIGLSKTGLSGAGLMVVPLMAGIFGGMNSVAVLLPMLIFADIFAVKHYNRHANWKHVIQLLPWALAGIVLATYVGKKINDAQFKQVLAIIIFIGIGLMLWQDLRKSNKSIPDKWWFAALLGLAGGFTTMVGNAAGPIMSLYLLSMRLPKNSYIGTGAWFFFIVNVTKIPFHVFSWKTINFDTLIIDLVVVPAIIIGVFIGIRIVRLFPEKIYRIFIILTTVLSAIFLF